MTVTDWEIVLQQIETDSFLALQKSHFNRLGTVIQLLSVSNLNVYFLLDEAHADFIDVLFSLNTYLLVRSSCQRRHAYRNAKTRGFA